MTKFAAPDHGTLLRMLHVLKLTREAEHRIERVLYRQGKIVGGVYVSRGQEAISVGAALHLREGDVVTPTHRDFAAQLLRGMKLRELFANWMARAGSPTRGRDGGPHVGDVRRGIFAPISSVGSWCPVVCGAAMVLKRRGNGNIALAFFGEGTSSRGDVHEAMNWAAVMKLPVVFVCNNNGWAYSTPPGKQYAVKSLAVRGPAYGMPGASVDGNDVLAVYREVGKAVARARGGKGPSFVECKTFRMTGHSAHDDAEYVPPKFFKEWQRKDPIQRFEKWLLQKKIVNRARIRSLEEEIRREVDNAVAAVEASPFPRPEECLEGVYCGPECWWDGRPGPGAPEGARRKGQNRA